MTLDHEQRKRVDHLRFDLITNEVVAERPPDPPSDPRYFPAPSFAEVDDRWSLHPQRAQFVTRARPARSSRSCATQAPPLARHGRGERSAVTLVP